MQPLYLGFASHMVLLPVTITKYATTDKGPSAPSPDAARCWIGFCRTIFTVQKSAEADWTGFELLPPNNRCCCDSTLCCLTKTSELISNELPLHHRHWCRQFGLTNTSQECKLARSSARYRRRYTRKLAIFYLMTCLNKSWNRCAEGDSFSAHPSAAA